MLPTDRSFADAIERVVSEIEARTDAEVVVVTAPCSGSYRDVTFATAAAVGWGVLAFLIWSPIPFEAVWFPVEVAAAGGLTAWAMSSPSYAVRLTTRARRQRQVRESAHAAFAVENVHATAARTGVLVYVSACEGEALVLPDHGLLGRIPGTVWADLAVDARSLDSLVAGLRALGEILAEHVPVTAGDRDELANTPVIRS